MAVLTKSLTRLRSDFNVRFPSRLTTSDGWIGDYEHQQGKSGHNPDDTAGSQPEYTDPDSKAEVRAIDVDKDLRASDGTTMQQVCDAIRGNERDRKRLAYMIYNRRIASQSSGWAWQTYSGSNPHTEHAHFSGDPDYDEDGAEFTSVTRIGDEDDMPSAEEVADAVWSRRYREYEDEGDDGTRDDRTTGDLLAATHDNAVDSDDKLTQVQQDLASLKTDVARILELLAQQP